MSALSDATRERSLATLVVLLKIVSSHRMIAQLDFFNIYRDLCIVLSSANNGTSVSIL